MTFKSTPGLTLAKIRSAAATDTRRRMFDVANGPDEHVMVPPEMVPCLTEHALRHHATAFALIGPAVEDEPRSISHWGLFEW